MRNGAKTGLPTYPATEKARTLFYDQTGTECNEKENSTINFNESKQYDTMKTIIASPKAPKAVGPYSQAVKCGDTLYISGQLPIDGATGAMPESIEDQTRQSLTNLGHILEEAGYSHADIVKTTVLLTDIADFAAMNAVYATFFTKDMPARICYQRIAPEPAPARRLDAAQVS